MYHSYDPTKPIEFSNKLKNYLYISTIDVFQIIISTLPCAKILLVWPFCHQHLPPHLPLALNHLFIYISAASNCCTLIKNVKKSQYIVLQ